MKPTQITHSEVTIEAIQNALSTTSKNLEKKLLALQLLITGKTHKETCEILRIGRNTLTRWIKVVNEQGLEGLNPSEKIGRPPKLSDRQISILQEALKKSPADFGLKGKSWTGRVIQRFFKKEFNKTFSLSAAYKIYHKVSASKPTISMDKGPIMDDALLFIIKKYRSKLVYNLMSGNAP
jgi:transposase